MQKFDRSTEPPPRLLLGKEAEQRRMDLLTLFADQERRAQTKVSLAPVLDDESVGAALRALFRGKCAFCETRTGIKPYRFRPGAAARPSVRSDEAHLYYTWLADAWQNIYAICEGCRPADPDHFPVERRRAVIPTQNEIDAYVREGGGSWWTYPPSEAALLLEPCVVGTFYNHLHPSLEGVLVSLSPRGAATIDHFNLNRLDRVAARADAYRDLGKILLDMASNYEDRFDLEALADRPSPHPSDVFGFLNLEFGGTWYLVLRRLAIKLNGSATNAMTPANIGALFQKRLSRNGAYDELLAGFDALRQQDTAGPPLQPEPVRPRGSSARLKSIAISDFKGIEALALKVSQPEADSSNDERRPRTPALLILGENATCKSTILEAIALTLSGPDARKALDLDPDNLRLDPGLMGDDRSAIRARAEVRLGFDDGGERRLTIDARGISAEGRDDLPPVFAYGAFRQYLRGRRNWTPHKSVVSLFQSDTILSNPEEWLLSLGRVEFNAVIRTLRDIFAVEGEFDVVRAQPERKRCVVVHKISTASGVGSTRSPAEIITETPLSLVSSGFRSILAMACDVLQGLMDERVNAVFESFETARGVVLIDEIEAHLHPRWKMQIMSGLRAALPQVTFIATTHDPLCLRGMDDGEVLVLHRIAGKETRKTKLPVFVEQLVGLPGVSQLTLEQLLTSDFFSLFSTDSPKAEQDLAAMADLLAKRARWEGRPKTPQGALLPAEELATPNPGDGPVPLTAEEVQRLERFEIEIALALPVGASPVQRLVQSAVAEYLATRRQKSAEDLRNLEEAARQKIVAALERF